MGRSGKPAPCAKGGPCLAPLVADRSILLVRHGKPATGFPGLVGPTRFREWVTAYDRGGLAPDSVPPTSLVAALADVDLVVISPLPRAVASADRLGIAPHRRLVDPLFVEAPLPAPPSWTPPLPGIAMAALLRLAWMAGLTPGEESYHQAQERATRCADRLVMLAEKKRGVVLVGHGILNRLIAGELRRRGWRGPRNPGAGYWSMARYVPWAAPERWRVRALEESG